jgi:hypothetical protein
MTKAEKFVSMCTRLPFEEVKDDRDETAIQNLSISRNYAILAICRMPLIMAKH